MDDSDEYDEIARNYTQQAQAQAHTSSGIGGLIILGIIIYAIWFFFIRVDYHDFWYNGSGYAFVTYCGRIGVEDCDAHPTEYLPVDHIEKAKSATGGGDIHVFEISFNNGGSIEVEGFCYQAASGLSYDRVCITTHVADDGNWYRYQIHN